jgi:4-hydroxybenzoate polyprenyltransferase
VTSLKDTVLCVDLDGTLIQTDILVESLIALIRKSPFYLTYCLFWLIVGGKAFLKQQVARRTELSVAYLPYNTAFLNFLQEEYNNGRKLILVTAADKTVATQIANHLDLFTQVLASDGKVNLKGKYKRELLNQTFGEKKYDYAGNDKSDLKVWSSSRASIIVNANKRTLEAAKKISTIERVFVREKAKFTDYLKLLRVHQYIKNALVFLPLVVGHFFLDSHSIYNSLIAFISFCLISSSVYLLNDMLDLTSDRKHPSKCHRAFAGGKIPLSFGLISAPLLLLSALALSKSLPNTFTIAIISYYLATLAYSFLLKRKMLIDVIVLACLYTIRIIAGIAAINSIYSPWLLTFSIFFFLSLAFAKRYIELRLLSIQCVNKKTKMTGRGYQISDIHVIQLFGIVSGYLSILVLAQYINSNKAFALYRHSEILWLFCLIVLYWISRVWLLASRGKLHEDPIIFAIHDKGSWLCLLAAVIIIFSAM